MIIFNKLDNYFVVSADSQIFLGFEMTANFRDIRIGGGGGGGAGIRPKTNVKVQIWKM